MIAVDGSKIWARLEAGEPDRGRAAQLAREIVDEAARADGEGCDCAGHQHGEAAGLDGPDLRLCDGGMLPGWAWTARGAARRLGRRPGRSG